MSRLPICAALPVCLLFTGCTLLAGARLSAGPAVDTDGQVGVELALDVSWGMSDAEGVPMVDTYALLETVRLGAGLYANGNTVNTSAGIEYVKQPFDLGLGIGLRSPVRADGAMSDEDTAIGDLLSLEFSAARLWNLRHEQKGLVNAGVELHCGYQFLAGRAMCSLGPWIGVARYKHIRLPH